MLSLTFFSPFSIVVYVTIHPYPQHQNFENDPITPVDGKTGNESPLVRYLPNSPSKFSSDLATAGVGQRSRWRRQTDRERFSMDLLRILIAILLPPLGVFLQVGIGKQFFINVILTILGYIPGIIHAVWVIAKY
jgi:uncharacterized membrane protein YqaE (UPF0057 family)